MIPSRLLLIIPGPRILRAIALPFCVALMDCDSPLEPYEDQGVNPAWIAYAGLGPEITLPDSVIVGSTIEGSVTTYRGACTSDGQLKVSQHSMQVDISPLSIYPKPGGFCIDLLVMTHRRISLNATTRGVLTVHVHGSNVTVLPSRTREAMTVTRTIVIY